MNKKINSLNHKLLYGNESSKLLQDLKKKQKKLVDLQD